MKILTSAQMRQAEEACTGIGITTEMLMENAGRAVAEKTRQFLGTLNGQHILVLVGPGNNGGDGLVAARYLHDWGASVSVYLCSRRPPDNHNLKLVREHGIATLEAAKDESMAGLAEMLATTSAVIDAIFGTGKIRPLADTLPRALNGISEAKKRRPSLRIIALDLPSGLDGDTGGVDPACLYADDTITLAFPKPGLFSCPGTERVGRVTTVDIGIPVELAPEVMTELITRELMKPLLPPRPLWANKGTFGRVLVVASSVNYIGAASLACTGAMRAGAGLVTLATPASLQTAMAARMTETTYLPLPEAAAGVISPAAAVDLLRPQLAGYDVLLAGCGLGQSEPVSRFLKALLLEPGPSLLALVLDADALNILAKTPNWWQRMANDAILTPHHGEMARLIGSTVAAVQSDRLGLAKKTAQEWRKTIVLKGAYTVIAAPDGRVRVSPFANPGMASAGTGDVLSGAIAGLVAQGLSLFDAATLGVYLHGQAGEVVRDRLGDTGMIATDLLPELPLVIKHLKEG
ncbi:MAG: NAD(P)H-hydrate dehydratase [Chloroflexi bacterium]|nr:NAD(P)H-hydrate dehydratase [Chloroflexota bacterium]